MGLISCAPSSFLEPSELCADTLQQELVLHDSVKGWILSLEPGRACSASQLLLLVSEEAAQPGSGCLCCLPSQICQVPSSGLQSLIFMVLALVQ